MVRYRSRLLIVLLVVVWILCSSFMFNNYKESLKNVAYVTFPSEVSNLDIGIVSPNSTCRYTKQSYTICVDELGYICNYTALLTNSCCPSEIFEWRFACHTCKDNHCCSVYEHCVSCCLDPNNKSLWNQVIQNTNANSRRHLQLATDAFEFCSAVCRTSSLTVLHENRYRNSAENYCFALEIPTI
uniref:SREBP regulating gene protein n=1 Tax=Trichobilharzia regenti TaxID=157069 RepID=A0AA85K2A7_TRIRE|nr:unnamed protein product [Trichobilharzia regenti]